MDKFDQFVENARHIKANKSQLSDQLKLQFMNKAMMEMGRESFVYDRKLEKLFYVEKNLDKKRREYLILAEDHLYCVYCLCYGEKNCELGQNGLHVESKNVAHQLRRHESTKFHENSEKEYQRRSIGVKSAVSQNISRNRHIVDAVLCSVMYIISHGMFTNDYYNTKRV